MRRSSLALVLSLALLGCRGTPEPRDGEEVPPYPWATQTWRATILQRLHETRVTQTYDGVALANILDDISIRARVNVRTDPELFRDAKDDLLVVRARLRDCPADEALDAILVPLGLDWALRDEFVYVATSEHIPPSQEKDDVAERVLRAREARDTKKQREAAQAKLERLEVKVDYVDMPLESVLEDLSARGEVPIRFDRPGIGPPRGAPGITMKSVYESRAASLLSIFLTERGLGTLWKGAELRVVPRAEAELAARHEAEDRALAAKRVTVSVEKAPLRDLAKALTQAAGAPVLPDEATWNRQDLVTLKVTDVELGKILRDMTADGLCDTVLMEGVIYFLAPKE